MTRNLADRNLADFQSMPASCGARRPCFSVKSQARNACRTMWGNAKAARLWFSGDLGQSSGRRAPGRRRRELGLQGGNAGLERFVLLPRQPGHLLDGLELLAMDHAQAAQNPLPLGAHYGV